MKACLRTQALARACSLRTSRRAVHSCRSVQDAAQPGATLPPEEDVPHVSVLLDECLHAFSAKHVKAGRPAFTAPSARRGCNNCMGFDAQPPSPARRCTWTAPWARAGTQAPSHALTQ